jgi:hypothetical protein
MMIPFYFGMKILFELKHILKFIKINFSQFSFRDRRIVYGDLSKIAPEHYTKKITARLTDIKAVETPADRSAFIAILESMYRFTLGSIAGAGTLYNN